MRLYSHYIILLLLCLFTRALTAVYFAEDPEEVTFFMALASGSTEIYQYPLFHFLLKIFSFISLPLISSFLGGLGVFLIIFFLLKIQKVPLTSVEGMITAFLVFFNPLLWISSNKYLPDVLATSVVIAAFSYLVPDQYSYKRVNLGWFLFGLLPGLKLFYLPFLLLPAVYAYYSNRKLIGPVIFTLAGIMCWFLPVVIGGHWDGLLGGWKAEFVNIETSLSVWQKISGFFHAIWTQSLGGFWIDRDPVTLVITAGTVFCLFFGFMIILSFDFPRSKMLVMLLSIVLYSCLVMVFSDGYNIGSHLLPLIPFLMILVGYGIIYFLVNFNYLSAKILISVFFISICYLTVVLVVQHTRPCALLQAKNYIEERYPGDRIIVANKDVRNFLSMNGMKAQFMDMDDFKKAGVQNKPVIAIGDSIRHFLQKPQNSVIFQHNPYVNKYWSEIPVYEY